MGLLSCAHLSMGAHKFLFRALVKIGTDIGNHGDNTCVCAVVGPGEHTVILWLCVRFCASSVVLNGGWASAGDRRNGVIYVGCIVKPKSQVPVNSLACECV